MDNNNSTEFDELENYGIDHKFINSEAPIADILKLVPYSKKACYESHEVIYREGASADTIYFLNKGMVKLISYLPNGRARIVRLHGAGSAIGLSSIFDPNYEHTAIAIEDIEVIKVPSKGIMNLKNNDPDTFIKISQKWYEYLRAADTWITQFSTGSIKARAARFITFLAYLQKDSDNEYVKLLQGEDMASILGVTHESVSRILADFKRRNILQSVHTDHGEIFKRDIAKLEEIALD